jgi:hypothetical protein
MEPEALADAIKRLTAWAEQHAPEPEPELRERLLPDADGRRRLLALYGEGLDLTLDDAGELVDELAGTSPAFIRELLRRGALVAADESDDGPLRVTERELRDALAELRAGADELTRTLLGDGADALDGA